MSEVIDKIEKLSKSTATILASGYGFPQIAQIRFIKGRVNFEVDGHKSKDPAPFPSMIVVFNGKNPTNTVKSITA